MIFEGFMPYEPDAAARYGRRRWWLGITLGDMFDKACDLYPSKEALVGSGRRYTYSRLRHIVDTMAYRLLQEGLKPGDRVLLQLPNWPEFVISYFALQKDSSCLLSRDRYDASGQKDNGAKSGIG
jgi:non-ribosomal peptide synthetase component E (peptide arylation enzyme)